MPTACGPAAATAGNAATAAAAQTTMSTREASGSRLKSPAAIRYRLRNGYTLASTHF